MMNASVLKSLCPGGQIAAAGLAATMLLAQPASAEMPPRLNAIDESAYRAAFLALESGTDVSDALAGASAVVSDRRLLSVLEWLRLQEEGTFADISRFLADHPSWPERTQLRLRAERSIPEDIDPEEVAAFFDDHPPLTVVAAARYEETLREIGRAEDAARFIDVAWPRLPLTTEQIELFVAYLPSVDEADHAARLSSLVSAGRYAEARVLLPYLDPGYEALLEARRALIDRLPDVNERVAAVPEALSGDAGLILDRARWRRRSGLLDGAIAMLDAQPADANGSEWWSERRTVARRLLTRGDPARAYAVASQHQQTGGLPRYQAEFLSGWIALRLLGDADAALAHFNDVWDNSVTPIGRATGAYWIARSYAVLGDGAAAQDWYAEAATRPTAYYGQLAAEAIGVTIPPADPPVGTADAALFAGGDLPSIVLHLDQIGESGLRDSFFEVLLENTGTGAGFVLAARLAQDLGLRWGMVEAAEKASRAGVELGVSGYPVLGGAVDQSRDPALILSIIRQESDFRPGAVSRAGAMGMMQLVPATARSMANRLGLAYEQAMLLADPDYNIRLGTTYLEALLGDYRDSVILAAVAYNAGPSRADDWITRLGDPRAGADPVDWVERIPFNETRNYVQRVIEAHHVYAALLGEQTVP